MELTSNNSLHADHYKKECNRLIYTAGSVFGRQARRKQGSLETETLVSAFPEVRPYNHEETTLETDKQKNPGHAVI